MVAHFITEILLTVKDYLIVLIDNIEFTCVILVCILISTPCAILWLIKGFPPMLACLLIFCLREKGCILYDRFISSHLASETFGLPWVALNFIFIVS